MSRESAIAQLRDMDVDQSETGEKPMLNKINELRRESRELLDGLAREDQRREEDERIERLVGERLKKIEENTRPREPQYKPRRAMTVREKSDLISKIGGDAYLRLPW
jgi:hypothetical protein